MKTVLISPFSRKLRNFDNSPVEKINPKNYPYWPQVVKTLQAKGIKVLHITEDPTEEIGADNVIVGAKLKDLRVLLDEIDTWAAVDNFFGHFAACYNKKGVVVFSKSDPNIYGYDQNINLLKDRKYLRPDQFQWWEMTDYNKEAFVEPEKVVEAILSIIGE